MSYKSPLVEVLIPSTTECELMDNQVIAEVISQDDVILEYSSPLY